MRIRTFELVARCGADNTQAIVWPDHPWSLSSTNNYTHKLESPGHPAVNSVPIHREQRVSSEQVGEQDTERSDLRRRSAIGVFEEDFGRGVGGGAKESVVRMRRGIVDDDSTAKVDEFDLYDIFSISIGKKEERGCERTHLEITVDKDILIRDIAVCHV